MQFLLVTNEKDFVHNVEKYVSQCFESVINQSYQNIEILIMDDGSKDLSSEICRDYASRDLRIV